MSGLRRFLNLFSLGFLWISLPTAAAVTAPHYHLEKTISGPDGLWDYVSVDPSNHQLYIGKAGGLMAIDLDSGVIRTNVFTARVVHQALPIGTGRIVLTTGEQNEAVVVDGASGKVLFTVPTGKDSDAVAYDQKTRQAIVFNRGDDSATLFDVDTGQVTGSLKLPGSPEFGVADDNGKVYVNIKDRNEVAIIDMQRRAVVQTFPLPDCEGPSGLGIDKTGGLLIAACDNGIAGVVTTTGSAVSTLVIGAGPDAAFVDEERRLAFIPSGDDGTLAVISLANPHAATVVARIKTRESARTGAVDPSTGKIYLPIGKLTPPLAPATWPSVVPGTFRILVFAP